MEANEVWIVDLDHTLVRVDTGVEGFFKLLKKNPFQAVSALKAFFSKGLGAFKEVVCRQAPVDVNLLPYRWELIEQLKVAKAAGHRMILATASHEITAKGVAKYLGIFDDIIATRNENLKGSAKTKAIREWIGDQPFLYWGDSEADFEVWKEASRVGVVNPSKDTLERILAEHPEDRVLVFRDPPTDLKTFLKAVRVHQWAKNLLVFLPIFGAHLIFDFDTVVEGLLAALSFSFVASSIYLINDILDAEADRKHVSKKNRPFAQGDFSVEYGLRGAFLFLLVGFGVCFFLPPSFLDILIAYFLLTFLYSVWLKQILLLDVMFLAGLYLLRVFAGGAATSIVLSHWLVSFSVFFFLSLGFVKRYAELRVQGVLSGQGYRLEDRPTILALGIGSGLISVLVFSFAIASPEVAASYAKEEYLWAAVPLLFFWVSRLWLLAERGEMHEDPVLFSLKDRVSYFLAVCFIGVFILAAGVFSSS
jgi:4-hydroxybenzoate polyprenyltransferase